MWQNRALSDHELIVPASPPPPWWQWRGHNRGGVGDGSVNAISRLTVAEATCSSWRDTKTMETTEWKNKQEKEGRMVTSSAYPTWLTVCQVYSEYFVPWEKALRSPFYLWGHWGSKELSHTAKVRWLVNIRDGICTQKIWFQTLPLSSTASGAEGGKQDGTELLHHSKFKSFKGGLMGTLGENGLLRSQLDFKVLE